MDCATAPLSAKPKRDSVMDGEHSGSSSQSPPSPYLAPPVGQHLGQHPQQLIQPTPRQGPLEPLFRRVDGAVFTVEKFAICMFHADARHKLGLLDPAARIQFGQMRNQHPGAVERWFKALSPQAREVLKAHQANAIRTAQAEFQARSTQQPGGPHPASPAYQAQQMRPRETYSSNTPAQALSPAQRPVASLSQQAIPTAQMDPLNGQQYHMYAQAQALSPPGLPQTLPDIAAIQARQQHQMYVQAAQLDGMPRTNGEAQAMAGNIKRKNIEQDLGRSQAAASMQPPARPVPTANMCPPPRPISTGTMQPPSRPSPAVGKSTGIDAEVMVIGSRPRTQKQQPGAESQQHRVTSGRVVKATRSANTPFSMHPLPKSVEEEVRATPPEIPAFVRMSDLEIGTTISDIHAQYAARANEIRTRKCLLDPSFAEQERLSEAARKEHVERAVYVPEPTIEAARRKARQSGNDYTLKGVPFVTADTPKTHRQKSAKEKKKVRIT